MKIKICGIKNLDEAKIMNETNPDFIGFIFAKSKREITIEKAREIKEILNPEIKTTGVFVETSIFDILKFKNVIDVVQFHGQYTEDDIKRAKDKGFETIKVIRVQKDFYEIETEADYLLFDSYSKTQSGGLNKTFDWNIKIQTNKPFFIAGGINESNVLDMIEKFHPYGADISSGVEVSGFKTKEKVSNIIKIIRGKIL